MSQRDRWEAAARMGTRLAGAGLKGVSRAEMDSCVGGLRAAAARAPGLIAATTQLPPATTADVNLVVDRAGIIRANLATSRRMFEAAGQGDPGFDPEDVMPPPALLGAALAVLSSRILGQFDPFARPPRLLLVAPNIIRTERALGADPDDFRLWVCLHEQTHRAQFTAAPWLVDHLLALVGRLIAAEAGGEPAPRPAKPPTASIGLLGALSDPATRVVLNDITAVMSLLEGYADVMMDAVGPSVIATLPSIRAAFDQHRAKKGLAAVLGKLLGLDAKLAQYTEGAAFCRAVLAGADLATLNLAYATPDYLPTVKELRAPQQWLDRIAQARREAARREAEAEAEAARLLAEAPESAPPESEPEPVSRLGRWWRGRRARRTADDAVDG